MESEEEDEEESKKKSRIADSTGQKRKEAATETTTTHTRAKAKAADPVGSKRKPSKGAEGTQSPVKAKVADPTGEKRKADSDAEDMEDAVGQGSPIRSRVEEDEDIRRVTTLHPTCDILQLHSVSSLATKAERLGMTTMDLEQWDIDIAANRDSSTEWVR